VVHEAHKERLVLRVALEILVQSVYLDRKVMLAQQAQLGREEQQDYVERRDHKEDQVLVVQKAILGQLVLQAHLGHVVILGHQDL